MVGVKRDCDFGFMATSPTVNLRLLVNWNPPTVVHFAWLVMHALPLFGLCTSNFHKQICLLGNSNVNILHFFMRRMLLINTYLSKLKTEQINAMMQYLLTRQFICLPEHLTERQCVSNLNDDTFAACTDPSVLLISGARVLHFVCMPSTPTASSVTPAQHILCIIVTSNKQYLHCPDSKFPFLNILDVSNCIQG